MLEKYKFECTKIILFCSLFINPPLEIYSAVFQFIYLSLIVVFCGSYLWIFFTNAFYTLSMDDVIGLYTLSVVNMK